MAMRGRLAAGARWTAIGVGANGSYPRAACGTAYGGNPGPRCAGRGPAGDGVGRSGSGGRTMHRQKHRDPCRVRISGRQSGRRWCWGQALCADLSQQYVAEASEMVSGGLNKILGLCQFVIVKHPSIERASAHTVHRDPNGKVHSSQGLSFSGMAASGTCDRFRLPVLAIFSHITRRAGPSISAFRGLRARGWPSSRDRLH
jgi:hypothetical protein